MTKYDITDTKFDPKFAAVVDAIFKRNMEEALIKNNITDFCVAPWTHTYISPQGERRLCCASREPAQNFQQYIDTESGSGSFKPLTLEKWWNDDQIRAVRRSWLHGIVPPECEVCDKKLLNTDVYKDYFEHLFGDLKQAIKDSTDPDGYTTMKPISWDYRYSNVCNFKCRMCGDMLSSAWEVEVNQHNMVDLTNPKNNWMKPHNRHAIKQFTTSVVAKEFADAVESKSVREIYWVGGEPLLYDQHWQTMERIVELGYADQVRIRYNTNLSKINYKRGNLYDVLRNYEHWEICASIDGTGPVGEYIRTGLDYSSWLENFKMGLSAQRFSNQMRLDFTLTLPGMVELENIVDLANEFNSPLLSKVVFAFTPDIVLSPLALPRSILMLWIEQIQQRIKTKINPRTQSAWDMLEQLKTRPTFEEQWGLATAKNGIAKGKQHLLKLESIRKDAKLTMEDILQTHTPALDWWKNI
jgi:hypothetical protein